MTTRRKLLQMIGMGAAAPAVLPAPLETLADLRVDGVALSGIPVGLPGSSGETLSSGNLSRIDWARRQLEELADPRRREMRREDHYIMGLDPDVHALRSVSLSAKARIQKHRSFERQEAAQKRRLLGFLEGWWS